MWDNATINKWIVPYNPYLSQEYNCHIHVEVCATNKAVKYIYKYVYKGSDMTTITIKGEEIQANEILQYMTSRYISPVETCMRLFNFSTQGSSHSVVNLPIHLESMSMMTYRDQATTPQLQNLIRRGDRTKLTAFFNLCARAPEGTSNLLYKDVPKKYRWDGRNKRWAPYKDMWLRWGDWYTFPAGSGAILPSNSAVSSSITKSFKDIRTVNGVVHETFHDAALAAGYLENDREWEECLAEAVSFKILYALRQLFCTILVYCCPTMLLPFRTNFPEDYFKSITERDRQNNIEQDEEVRLRMAEYKCIKWVTEYLLSNRKRLDMHGLPELSTHRDVSEDVVANEIATYEPEDLARTTALADQMNENRKEVFDQVIEAVNHPVYRQKVFFVDGLGGTGKSFLL
ncbi:Helitron helicase [Phytophthora megakarya]|uniref:ATP-dependent DNA helicase n=1 Tax=Phytophthora megakarya TaxID=4795 RepID=A0A225UQN7_9STRA|nr:Helitron helicase [Phytophthora megakarya]